jgi:hypothetical protein
MSIGIVVLALALGLIGADLAVCYQRPKLWQWWGAIVFAIGMGGVSFGLQTILERP